RGVRLQKVMIINIINRDLPVNGAENATADRAAVTESITYDEDGLAQQIGRNVAEVHIWQGLVIIDFDESQGFVPVTRDVARLETLIVIHNDLDLEIGRALNHMFVSHNIARRIDDKS